MSLPVLLTSDMAGAPILNFANGSVINLLTACLVNGFNTRSVVSATASGGVVTFNFASAPGFSALDTVTVAGAIDTAVNGQKRVQSAAGNQVLVAMPGISDGAVVGAITLKFSPLGWTRPYTGTNLAAYRQGGAAAHKRFLRIFDGSTTTATPTPTRFYARGYENMTAISSGTGAFPTTAQVAGNGTEQVSVTDTGNFQAVGRPWFIVGTPRFFYFCFGYNFATSFDFQNTYGPAGQVAPLPTLFREHSGVFMFGELANVTKAADTYAIVIPTSYSNAQHYIARSVSSVIGAVDCILGNAHVGQLYTSGAVQYPSSADGGLHLRAPDWAWESGNASYPARGTIPGLLYVMESPAQSPIAGQQQHCGKIFNNVPGVTGRLVLGAHQHQNWQDMLFMLDEDWGDL
jgi:hypothetical protein